MMLRCQIADLLVEVPTAGDMFPRCKDYLTLADGNADIKICAEEYRFHVWHRLDENGVCYMESGIQFYTQLVAFEGMMLHASAVELEGKAYLFSGPCGMGKSTHTHLWQQTFGGTAQVFNDDKPALRRIEGKWYAYGTPWCGKDGINQNRKVPLAGICFLKQAEENCIRQLSQTEAMIKVISQTRKKFKEAEQAELMLGHVEKLVREIPIFELQNRPEPEAARLSYETMRHKAEEMGL